MEWVWLLLAIVGLGILWMLIVGVEKLTERLRLHDEARNLAARRIAAETDAAEADFMEKQYIKADAKAFIENADFSNQNDPDNTARLQSAISTLSSAELVEALTKRTFGTTSGTAEITANQSAFEVDHLKTVVARSSAVNPVKVKPATKSALSKSEQKMLKKIRQGDWLFTQFWGIIIPEKGRKNHEEI